jgi:hypothetical protein
LGMQHVLRSHISAWRAALRITEDEISTCTHTTTTHITHLHSTSSTHIPHYMRTEHSTPHSARRHALTLTRVCVASCRGRVCARHIAARANVVVGGTVRGTAPHATPPTTTVQQAYLVASVGRRVLFTRRQGTTQTANKSSHLRHCCHRQPPARHITRPYRCDNISAFKTCTSRARTTRNASASRHQ